MLEELAKRNGSGEGWRKKGREERGVRKREKGEGKNRVKGDKGTGKQEGEEKDREIKNANRTIKCTRAKNKLKMTNMKMKN